MLNSLTPEAGKCCEKSFNKLSQDAIEAATVFVCPRCICEYKPRIEGAIRVWECIAWMETFLGAPAA